MQTTDKRFTNYYQTEADLLYALSVMTKQDSVHVIDYGKTNNPPLYFIHFFDWGHE